MSIPKSLRNGIGVFPYGDIIYTKLFSLTPKSPPKKIVIRFKYPYKGGISTELVATDGDKHHGKDQGKQFNFKHGSKSLYEGYRWYRKKTSEGYSMGLIVSSSIACTLKPRHVPSSIKSRSKTFIEVFSPFEYKILQHAHKKAVRERKENAE